MSHAEETLAARIDRLMPHARVHLPDGPGPFPVVIQMHGCGGVKPMQQGWADAANEAGWAAVVLDSYHHRGISQIEAYASVCTGARLWGRERAGDAFAAIAWLGRQDWADASRIVLAGWSHGGWTALDAMALEPGDEMRRATHLAGLPSDPLRGVIGAFVVYPFAGPGSVARRKGLRHPAEVAALVGERDLIVGGRSLARALTEMKTAGPPIGVTLLKGATHAFDESEARDLRVKYDPELTEWAHEAYRSFLRSLAERTTAAPVEPVPVALTR